jgi:hypothetical protein
MAPTVWFKLINDFIVAIAQLAWPIVALVIALIFRANIAAFLQRVRKGKLFGQEMELDPAVTEFSDAVQEAQNEIPDSTIGTEQFEQETQQLDRDEREVLKAAEISPELGVIRLSSILERETRRLAATLGQLRQRGRWAPPALARILVEKGHLPDHVTKSLQLFWDLRNQIVHGHAPNKDLNILRVLDIGLVLLRTIKSIPHEINVVYSTDVKLYSDPECIHQIEDAKGLVLETTSSDKTKVFKRIFPTIQPKYYQVGQKVTWEWNLSRVWAETWYRDPDTNEKKKAWDSAGEFTGRHIEDV